MTGWKIQSSYNGSYIDADVAFRNVTGAPLHAVTKIGAQVAGSNSTPSGVFRVAMQTSDTVSITTTHFGDLNSSVVFEGNRTVVADGVTPNYNIISGLSILFSANAVYGDVCEIGVGCYWDGTLAIWVRLLPFDLVVSTSIPEERLLYATNVSEDTQCNSFLVVSNAMRIVNGQAYNRPFLSFRQVGVSNPIADTDLNGRPVTFTDLVEGTPNTISILVDGSGVNVYDVTNEASISGGVGLKCDGTTVYRFDDSSNYRSGEFILSPDTSESDTATVYVSDGGDFVEISDGLTDFVPGNSGLFLTETDAPEGVVSNAVSITFKLRMVAPAGKTASMNQREFSIRIQSEGI